MPDHDAQRALWLSSITDIGRSVSNNDQKASAALIVHALLFAGVTTIVVKLGHVYRHAHPWQQDAGLALLILALVLFVGSVLAMVLAISPYRPIAIDADLGDNFRRIFFPDFHDLVSAEPKTGELNWYGKRMAGSMLPSLGHRLCASERSSGTASPLLKVMNLRAAPMSGEDVNLELAAEVLKLKDILDWESQWARWGYRLLCGELIAIGLLLGFVLLVVGT